MLFIYLFAHYHLSWTYWTSLLELVVRFIASVCLKMTVRVISLTEVLRFSVSSPI